MTRHERLTRLLKEHFPQAQFELIDDSAPHANHHPEYDGETHYRLRIQDTSFAGKPTVKIHREIFAAIKPETDAGLHSFVIEKAAAP